MLKDIIKYQLKTFLRAKEYLFWCFLFPIILSTLFQMTLANILEGESFERIPIAIVNMEEDKYKNFLSVLESVSSEGKVADEEILFSLKEIGRAHV